LSAIRQNSEGLNIIFNVFEHIPDQDRRELPTDRSQFLMGNGHFWERQE
jgi:hypothetical protein